MLSVKGMTGALAVALCAALAGCGTGLGGEEQPDPIALDYPIAYVKRPLARDEQGNPVQDDARELLDFTAGGDLYLRERAASGAEERNVTFRYTGGMGDVRDVEVSYDGTRLLFAMRAPEIPDAPPEDQPTWNIWEYDIAADRLRRVIESDITAELGQDVAPHYLPDGRIVFASTRQEQSGAVLIREGKGIFPALDEDRNEHAFVLHVMNADGSDIHQISYNQSHDLDPTVLADGRIAFVRWDAMGGLDAMHLYTIAPDGTGLAPLYGTHSHDTGTDGGTVQFLQPRELPGGGLLVLMRAFTGTNAGGNLALVDTGNYVDNDQPTWANLGALAGPAQTAATVNQVRTDAAPSPGGRFSGFYPLYDGSSRILVSWSPCRVVEDGELLACTPERLAAAGATEAPPLYGLWMYDMEAHTQQPVVLGEEGWMITDAVAVQPRELPAILPDAQPGAGLDAQLAEDGAGVLHIRSVYDFGDGTFDGCFFTDCAPPGITTLADLADPLQTTSADRPARFLRIVKAVSIPDDEVLEFDNDAFGVSAANGMREIIGYAPVDPDGSVRVMVPADVALSFDIVDAAGRRIGPRHRNWVQVRPGETLECTGCHSHSTAGGATPLPHGRPDAVAESINPGAPAGGAPFPNTDARLWTLFQETMAEVRTRTDPLAFTGELDPAAFALAPSVDLFYEDVWTDPGLRPRDPALAIRYSELATPAPTNGHCLPEWTSLCRVIINYEDHIQPLWERDRGASTCVSCHSPRDAMGAVRVPAGDLNLTRGDNLDASDVATQFKSYRELLRGDNRQEVADGVLQDILLPVDPPQCEDDGDPATPLPLPGEPECTLVTTTVPVGASMSTNGARASTRFFAKVDGSDAAHAHLLEPAELKLLAEWLDIGAQYYNNPFDAPPP